ncbi:hypothetical protein DIPPA_21646 [Diplonema papillatum]|nr:hypothetical protein DIPPA_21646 [Diplonema papillatum]
MSWGWDDGFGSRRMPSRSPDGERVSPRAPLRAARCHDPSCHEVWPKPMCDRCRCGGAEQHAASGCPAHGGDPARGSPLRRRDEPGPLEAVAAHESPHRWENTPAAFFEPNAGTRASVQQLDAWGPSGAVHTSPHRWENTPATSFEANAVSRASVQHDTWGSRGAVHTPPHGWVGTHEESGGAVARTSVQQGNWGQRGIVQTSPHGWEHTHEGSGGTVARASVQQSNWGQRGAVQTSPRGWEGTHEGSGGAAARAFMQQGNLGQQGTVQTSPHRWEGTHEGSVAARGLAPAGRSRSIKRDLLARSFPTRGDDPHTRRPAPTRRPGNEEVVLTGRQPAAHPQQQQGGGGGGGGVLRGRASSSGGQRKPRAKSLSASTVDSGGQYPRSTPTLATVLAGRPAETDPHSAAHFCAFPSPYSSKPAPTPRLTSPRAPERGGGGGGGPRRTLSPQSSSQQASTERGVAEPPRTPTPRGRGPGGGRPPPAGGGAAEAKGIGHPSAWRSRSRGRTDSGLSPEKRRARSLARKEAGGSGRHGSALDLKPSESASSRGDRWTPASSSLSGQANTPRSNRAASVTARLRVVTSHPTGQQQQQQQHADAHYRLKGIPVDFVDDDGDLIEFLPSLGSAEGHGARYSVNSVLRPEFSRVEAVCNLGVWRLRCHCPGVVKNVPLPRSAAAAAHLLRKLAGLFEWCRVVHDIPASVAAGAAADDRPASFDDEAAELNPAGSAGDPADASDADTSVTEARPHRRASNSASGTRRRSPAVASDATLDFEHRLAEYEKRIASYWKNKRLVDRPAQPPVAVRDLAPEYLSPSPNNARMRALMTSDRHANGKNRGSRMQYDSLLEGHLDCRGSIQVALEIDSGPSTPEAQNFTLDAVQRAGAIRLASDLKRREAREEYFKSTFSEPSSEGGDRGQRPRLHVSASSAHGG